MLGSLTQLEQGPFEIHVMAPILQMKTPRLRELKGLAKVTELGRGRATW